MRSAFALPVPQTVHPELLVAIAIFFVYFAPPHHHLFSPLPKPPYPIPQDLCTPLHSAAGEWHEAACRVLVEAGANVDALDYVRCHCS